MAAQRDAWLGYLFILGTLAFTVYGQCVLKWQVRGAQAMPEGLREKVGWMAHLLTNPWVLSGLLAGFLAFVCWTMALSKFDLSYAYPFMSLSFALVLVASAVLFRESITLPRVAGLVLIMAGVVVGSRG